MMRGVVVAVVCLSGVACFSKPPPPDRLGDGGGSSDGSMRIDAGPQLCMKWGLFSSAIDRLALSTATIAEPTLPNDETDLIFMAANGPSEATRTSASANFGQVIPLTSLIGTEVVTSVAWLSPNRLTLYEIASGGVLLRAIRQTLGDNFLTPAPGDVLVMGNVQDATFSSDEQRLIYATGGVLMGIEYSTDPPVTTSVMTKEAGILFSPSIGDHDRALVWSQSEQAMPMTSELWIGELMDMAVTGQQRIGLPQPMYYAGAILSYDGTTLYYTAASDSTMDLGLYKVTRSCLDGSATP